MGKKTDVKFVGGLDTATLFTKHPRTFVKLADEFNYSECGVAFVVNDKKDLLFKFGSLDESIAAYQKVVDMVEINEAERLKIEKNLLKKLKEKAIHLDNTYISSMTVFWLLYRDNNPKFWIYLTFLLLVGCVDFVEAYRIIKLLFVKPEDRAVVESDLLSLGILEPAINCMDEKNVSLYFKI